MFYIQIGGAYGECYWITDTLNPEDWQSWECGERIIVKVDGEKVFEPLDGTGEKWRELARSK